MSRWMNLCDTCSSLNISADKFDRRVEDGAQHGGDGFDNRGLEVIEIGYLDNFFRRRDDCPFCRLIYEAIHTDNGSGIGHDGLDRDGARVSCWLDWQLDGRHSSQVLTRRLRLFSRTHDFEPCYLVPLQETRDIQNPSFKARSVHATQVDLRQIQTWIELCEKHHHVSCGREPQLTPPMELRVIDVTLKCLTTIPSTERYCTLSYCWGRTPQFTTTLANFTALTAGFPLESLPRTIRDAIELVAAFGEKYIWVDALCIVQDDMDDWRRIAPLMDKIYGGSTLNICAASGENSQYGLPGSRTGTRSLNQVVQNCNGLNLVVIRSLEDRIKISVWNSRAWTFQERMLSKRCLIFVDQRVFFQCRQTTWSEELECESTLPSWTLDMIHSPLGLFDANPLRRFAKMTELYSGRSLSFHADRLVAFEGIARTLAQDFSQLHDAATSTNSQFHYGLPACYFDWALLWELKGGTKRIGEDLARGTFFPSWSWCGWDGASEWRMSTTSSTLLNLHEWLLTRTWIIWYIGTDSGHTPVFQASEFLQASRLGRWAGYTASERDTSSGTPTEQDEFGRLRNDRHPVAVAPQRSPLSGHLLFFTWSAFFTLSRKSRSERSFRSNLPAGLHRFGIEDCKGDWCGTIVLDSDHFNCVGAAFEFIAISEARDFAMEEYDSWNYYISGEREETEWYLYYALMIRWNEDNTVAERLGLAKIFKVAFESGSLKPGSAWKEIMLG